MAGRAPRSTATLTSTTGGKARARHRILIIEARFNPKVADELAAGAIAELEACGVAYDRVEVPGALEIAQVLAGAIRAGIIPSNAPAARYAGAIALGCVIRGETTHYEIVCENSNHWLLQLAVRHAVPVGNAILTVETEAQAMERARGGRDGKGADAVRACLRVIEIAHQFAGHGA